MNCDLMKQYIEFVADRLLLELGFDKVGLFHFSIANFILLVNWHELNCGSLASLLMVVV